MKNEVTYFEMLQKSRGQPWPGSSAGQIVLTIRQGYRFSLQLGHI